MWNVGYHLGRVRGGVARETYRMLLPMIVRRRIDPPQTLDLDVFAYSNEAMLPEQVASIRSFLKYGGRPNRFTIVSDGTHRPRSLSLLQQIDSCIRLAEACVFSPRSSFSRDSFWNPPTCKKVALIMILPLVRLALYNGAGKKQ